MLKPLGGFDDTCCRGCQRRRGHYGHRYKHGKTLRTKAYRLMNKYEAGAY